MCTLILTDVYTFIHCKALPTLLTATIWTLPIAAKMSTLILDATIYVVAAYDGLQLIQHFGDCTGETCFMLTMRYKFDLKVLLQKSCYVLEFRDWLSLFCMTMATSQTVSQIWYRCGQIVA